MPFSYFYIYKNKNHFYTEKLSECKTKNGDLDSIALKVLTRGASLKTYEKMLAIL